MKTKKDVEKLEKTIGQLDAVHREISLLSKKSPNDVINSFKLNMINNVLELSNSVMGNNYRPIVGFDKFDDDSPPSTSDVVFVIAQYMEEIERFRSDNVVRYQYHWYYVLNGKRSKILADAKSRGAG